MRNFRALGVAVLFLATVSSQPAFTQERGAAALDQLVRGLTVTSRDVGAGP